MAKSARFFDEDAFHDGLDAQVESAAAVEAQVRAAGAPPFARHVFDVRFASNDLKKLAALAKVLTGLGYQMAPPARDDDGLACEGTSMPLPVAEDTIVFWAIDLYHLGFAHDCKLEEYGTEDAPAPPVSASGEAVFDEALRAFERGNRGLALALFTQALAVEPDNPNTWYSRACLLDMIELGGAARRDYDRAIELAPRFSSALVNRGANKDEAGEYAAAIEDYDRAIAISDQNAAAFLNRGNSKHNAGDEAGAIADWKIAAGLGAALAKQRLAKLR